MGRGHNPQSTTETTGLRRSFLKCLPGRHVAFAWQHHWAIRTSSSQPISTGPNHARESGSEADAVYVNLTDRAIKDSAEVADGIVVNYDDEGRIAGVEILDASKRTDDPTTLTQFNLDLPKAG